MRNPGKIFFQRTGVISAIVFVASFVTCSMVGLGYIQPGTDLFNYYAHFLSVPSFGLSEFLQLRYEIGYELSAYVGYHIGLSFENFAALIFSLFLAVYFRYCSYIGGSILIGVISLFVFIVYPLSESYRLVFIRQTMSIGFILCSAYYILRYKYRLAIVFGLFAAAFHTSSILFFVTLVAVRFVPEKRDRWLVLMFVAFSLGYVFNVFAQFTTPVVRLGSALGVYEGYFLGGIDYETGFKWSFFLMTLVGFACSLWVERIYRRERILLRYFIISSCIYMLCSGIPYYDRIAAYSWSLIPLFVAQIIAVKFLPHRRRSVRFTPAQSAPSTRA